MYKRQDLDSSKISFEEALQRFSDDESKNNGGIILNPKNGTSFFTIDEIDPSIRYTVEKMKIGDISDPSLSKSQDGTQAVYRLIKLPSRVSEYVFLFFLSINSSGFQPSIFPNLVSGDMFKDIIQDGYIEVISKS